MLCLLVGLHNTVQHFVIYISTNVERLYFLVKRIIILCFIKKIFLVYMRNHIIKKVLYK